MLVLSGKAYCKSNFKVQNVLEAIRFPTIKYYRTYDKVGCT